MLNKKTIIWLIMFSILIGGCTKKDIKESVVPLRVGVSYTSEEEILGDYLNEDLWTKENIYDASHVLQVPLEAAFKLDNPKWKLLFSNQFKRFVENYNVENTTVDKRRLNFLHYLYLSSRFIKLAHEYDELELIPEGLVEIVYDNLDSIYFEEEAWQWDRKPFKNMQERLLWKIQNKDVKQSYYRAIIDEELFIFAIAANLRNHYTKDDANNKIDLILDMAYEVFRKESYFSADGGWLFQVGVWEDHSDYKYAGNLEKRGDISPSPVRGIATDSSHFHRFPLFIKDFITTYENEPLKREFFIKIREGLKEQFLNKVLTEPTEEFKGHRLNNYMDGRNGVYRWNYTTQGEGNGYGPYELSGTFFLGWWSFLGSTEVNQAYKYMSEQFPLDEELIATYVGPNTTRVRNKYVRLPDYFKNGFAEFIMKLITEMAGK